MGHFGRSHGFYVWMVFALSNPVLPAAREIRA